MTPAEASRLDPHQRLLLETVREAFETAGETGYRGKAIGTFAGVFSDDWQDMQNRDVSDTGTYQLTGKGDFMLANRISYEYDLTGPRSSFCVEEADPLLQHYLQICLLIIWSGSSPSDTSPSPRRNLIGHRRRRESNIHSWTPYCDVCNDGIVPYRILPQL
ncbi:hypothetical protein MY11210_008234 [Beauveria gryllotalpidicola]